MATLVMTFSHGLTIAGLITMSVLAALFTGTLGRTLVPIGRTLVPKVEC